MGYCLRVRRVKSDDDSPDKTHIPCRHRWPWCPKQCLCCAKTHSLFNSDLCKDCIEKAGLPSGKINPSLLPFKFIEPARVEHSTRFDKHGEFRMAPAHVVGPANTPSITTHNREHTFVNNGNTDLKHPINPGAVRCYTIGYLCKAYVTLPVIEENVQRIRKSVAMDPDMRDKPAAKFIQRSVSSTLASRACSTQNAV